jgi:hypothetical protein
MYIDVNGRISNKMMVGSSGKTYGNLTLLTPAELADALQDGISEYTPPAEPPMALPDAKLKKQAQIRLAYEAEASTPVAANGFTWNGGHSSAMAMDSTVRLAELKASTHVELWDASNVKRVVPISEGKTIVEAIADAFLIVYDKKQSLMVAVDNAADQAALDLVVW